MDQDGRDLRIDDDGATRPEPVGEGPDEETRRASAGGEPDVAVRADAAPEDASSRDGDAPDPDDDASAADLQAECDRIRDRHLRLAADFDNYRKRMEGRLRERWDRAQAELVGRLLDPLDDLLRVTALEPETASVEAIVEGVDLVERKFLQALADAGVEVVDPAGEAFDPNTMEAMMRSPADSEELDDRVERVFQRGYAFRGLLVRPARVSVFKA